MERRTEKLVKKYRIKATCKWADSNPYMSDMPYGSTHWRVTLKAGKLGENYSQMTVPFSQGPAHTKEPTASDVLYCLIADAGNADNDFESWASDLGFDTDSRKSERIYKAVHKQTEKLRSFLGIHFDEFVYGTDEEDE